MISAHDMDQTLRRSKAAVACFFCILFLAVFSSSSQAVIVIPDGVKKYYEYNQYDDSIILVKERLRELGYFKPDSTFTKQVSSELKRAVVSFQQKNNMKADGRIDQEFLTALFSEAAVRKEEEAEKETAPENGKASVNEAILPLAVCFLLILSIPIIIHSRKKQAAKSRNREDRYVPNPHPQQKMSRRALKKQRIIQEKARKQALEAQQRKEAEEKAKEAERNRKADFIKAGSARYKALCSLFSRYNLQTGFRTYFSYSYLFQRKNAFMEAKASSVLAFLGKDDPILRDSYEKIQANRISMEMYTRQNPPLPDYTLLSEAKIKNNPGITAEEFCRLEKEICLTMQKQIILDLEIELNLSYRSPAGRDHLSKTIIAHFADLEQAYAMRVIPDIDYSGAQAERDKMTTKLRYAVMQRDQFRCVLCGATVDNGAKLHVDHIIPVSKGGKTEMNNLRTLCDRCNLGKGASYNPNGMN